MCQNIRRILNPYDNRFYWTKCGKCDACLQEKADKHMIRIKNEMDKPTQYERSAECFFVTPTYDNEHIPYIKNSEFRLFLDFHAQECVDHDYVRLNIYRDSEGASPISSVGFEDFQNPRGHQWFRFDYYARRFKGLPTIRKRVGFDRIKKEYKFINIPDKVSICYLKDIQNFFKRLKIYLVRHGYKGYFAYYYAQEYGGKSYRYHPHLLIYFDKKFESFIKSAIIACWKFSDLRKPFIQDNGTVRYSIEVATDPASYVSSYISSLSSIPKILQEAYCFRPKIRFSNGFGCNLQDFSYSAILEKFYARDLRYSYTKTTDGITTREFSPLPKYVLLRYFPKFKGMCYLSNNEIYDILFSPDKVYDYQAKIGATLDECHKIVNYVYNKRRCFENEVKRGSIDYFIKFADYCFIGSNIWSQYASLVLKESWKDVTSIKDIFEHFDNIKDFVEHRVYHELLIDYFDRPRRFYFSTDPNKFGRNVAHHNRKVDRFIKHRKKHELHAMELESKEDI